MNETQSRLRELRRRLGRTGCEGLYVSALPNIRYLTGFTGGAARLLVTPKSAVLVTDARYRLRALEEVRDSGADVAIAQANPLEEFLEIAAGSRLRPLGFERNRLSFADYEALRGRLGVRRLKPLDGCVEDMRAVKSPAEIEKIRKAVQLNSEVFEAVIGRLRPGWTEARLAAELEYTMRIRGGDGPAFPTIVAGGPHGALPHASPRPQRLSRNSLITVDLGVILDGYASDMTRVIALGEPPKREREMAEAVLEAQSAAIAAVKAGVTASNVDRQARQALRRRKLHKLFVHSTGHGLGMEVHEPPRLGRGQRVRLRQGMVVTIEPGVYWEGIGGARIEDVVVVTKDGCEILTPSPRELCIL